MPGDPTTFAQPVSAASTLFGNAQTNVTSNTDNSQAFGVYYQQSGGQVGSNVSLANSSGNVLNMLDPGAIAAGAAIANTALNDSALAFGALNSSIQDISRRSFDLATAAQQGEGGTLINGLKWIVGLVVGGWVLWVVFKDRDKKKGGEK